jgi:hypothetical protein
VVCGVRFPKCACDGAMTQPITSVPYRAGAQIAADKTALLMGLQCEAPTLDPDFRPFINTLAESAVSPRASAHV